MEPEILKKLEVVEGRIGAIENRLGKVETLSVATSQKLVAVQNSQQITRVVPVPMPTRDLPEPPPPPPPIYRAVEKNVPPSISSGDFESYFGRWILGIVGLVSIIFGVSYFLKYAFDQNWISPAGRVVIGLSIGVLFIIVGEFIRKSQEKFSNILSATGLGLLYLSTYTAYGYYELLTANVSFLFMTAVTIFGVILSVWTNSETLASLTTAVGFLIPYLFGLRAASDFGYFIYTLSLNIGILSVALFRKWRQLTLIGFVGTILHFASWYGFYYTPDKLALATYALSVFYLIYLTTTIVNKFIINEKSDQSDLVMLTLNPIWFFSELYYLLQSNPSNFPGINNDVVLAFVAIGLSTIYIALAYLFKRLRNDDQHFTLFLSGVSALFLTIAIPLYFNKEMITIAWAIEAVILAILGTTTSNDDLRKASLIVLTVTLIRFLYNFDNYVDLATWNLIFNWQFLTYLILITATTVITYLLGQSEKYRLDKKLMGVLLTVINLLIFGAITSEIVTYFNQARLLENVLAENAIENQKNVAISVFWTIYAIILISLGILLQNPLLRKSALILFVLTTIKVFVLDLSGLATPYRIVSFMVLGLVLLVASYLYFRHQKSVEGGSQ